MKIQSIRFENGLYTISYLNENDEPKTLHGKCHLHDFRNGALLEDFENVTSTINFLTEDIKEAFWIGKDEYLIIYTKLTEIFDEDTVYQSVSLGDVRYYITTHNSDTLNLEFEVLSADDGFDIKEFYVELFNYLKWDW